MVSKNDRGWFDLSARPTSRFLLPLLGRWFSHPLLWWSFQYSAVASNKKLNCISNTHMNGDKYGMKQGQIDVEIDTHKRHRFNYPSQDGGVKPGPLYSFHQLIKLPKTQFLDCIWETWDLHLMTGKYWFNIGQIAALQCTVSSDPDKNLGPAGAQSLKKRPSTSFDSHHHQQLCVH